MSNFARFREFCKKWDLEETHIGSMIMFQNEILAGK